MASNSETVAAPNFPAYSICAVSGRYVVVGGGGGKAKTGIKNKFDVYELYHNGKQTKAERVVSHDVGDACISNLTGWCSVEESKEKNVTTPSIHLALGQEESCVILQLCPKFDSPLPVDDILLDDAVEEEQKETENTNLRHRIQTVKTENRDQNFREKPNKPNQGRDFRTKLDDRRFQEIAKKRKQERIRRESINSTLRGEQYFTFDVEVVASKRTVSCRKNDVPEDVYQKVVRVSEDQKLLATGGTDGYFRLWSLPDMSKIREVKAHEKEVDDLDFSPDSKQIVSLSKPTRECIIWNTKEGKKLIHLALQTNGVKYKFYRARYSTVEKNLSDIRLFTISNAVVGSKHPGIVAKWNSRGYGQEKEAEVKGTLSSLALSDTGRYLATGTMDGTVYILISFSLQVLQKVDNAHSVFVTGLAWLPTSSPESKMVRGYSEASVLSISCDNTLKIHHVPRQHMVPVWIVAILAAVVLFGAFALASFLGL